MAKINGKNSVPMVDFGAEIPQQVNVLLDVATKLGAGQWPSVDGTFPQRPTKKDVVGYLLYIGAKTMLEKLGIMDVAERTVEAMTGLDYQKGLYIVGEEESKADIADNILAGIKSTKS